MAKYNAQAKQYKKENVTKNKAGGSAFNITDEKKNLAGIILSAMLKGDSYYQSENATSLNIFNTAKSMQDKQFLAKAMIYTRQEGNLRSVSHLLANALAESAAGNSFVRSAISKTIVRPDDMTEMASLWFSRHNTMLPNSMRRAFKDVFESNKFDRFQLKRYSGGSKTVKLKDLVKLSHPRDYSGNLTDLLSDNLDNIKTIETMLSTGTKANEAFSELLASNKLGYMAALKNIRNALLSGIDENTLTLWCALISDPNKVRKSRVLPFRIYDAWLAVKSCTNNPFFLTKIKNALNTAIINSAFNLDFVKTNQKYALVLDSSSSMNSNANALSYWKQALILATITYFALGGENVVVYSFDSDCRYLDFSGKLPLDIIDSSTAYGGATYFDAPLKKLISDKIKVDNIILFTDMQLYSGMSTYYNNSYYTRVSDTTFYKYWNEYKRKSPRAKMLFWNLAPYSGTTPLQLNNEVLFASGYSDKLLSLIPKLWENKEALVNEIESISI